MAQYFIPQAQLRGSELSAWQLTLVGHRVIDETILSGNRR